MPCGDHTGPLGLGCQHHRGQMHRACVHHRRECGPGSGGLGRQLDRIETLLEQLVQSQRGEEKAGISGNPNESQA